MSYNTRRSSGFNPNQQNVGNIGQRRPVVTNNFVPGGQLQPQPQQKSQPGYNQPPQRSQQQGQQQAQINFRNQQQRQPQPQQQTVPPQAYGSQQPPQQPNFQQIKVEPTTPAKPPTPVVPAPNPPAPENKDVDAMDTSGEGEDGKVKRRPIWARGIKISRKEKLRRRNLRLSKMLQPKNAVMILHELVKNTAYEVEELSCKIDNNQYKATVMFEGETHVGLGRSKIQAKNAAAENALKYLVKNKQLKLTKSEEGTEGGGGGGRQDDTTEEGEKMDIQTDEGSTVMPWQHVASFALFKLFSSWGEDPVLTSRVSQAQELLGGPKVAVTPGERVDTITKPAKKLPNKPEEINPLMLLNQMCPQAQFEELGKAGTPPNVTFTFQVTIDGQTFNGSGPNKKTAKRLAAYAACHSVLKISYPPEIWVPGF